MRGAKETGGREWIRSPALYSTLLKRHACIAEHSRTNTTDRPDAKQRSERGLEAYTPDLLTPSFLSHKRLIILVFRLVPLTLEGNFFFGNLGRTLVLTIYVYGLLVTQISRFVRYQMILHQLPGMFLFYR